MVMNYPQTAATVASAPYDDYDWVDINNIKADDASYAYCQLLGTVTAYPHLIKASNFGFNFPSNYTILGIKAEECRKRVHLYNAYDSLIKASKDGTNLVGSNMSIGSLWSIDWETHSWGSSTNLWGATWTPAEINDPNFSIFFGCYGDTGIIAAILYVQFVRVTVYVHVPEKGPLPLFRPKI